MKHTVSIFVFASLVSSVAVADRFQDDNEATIDASVKAANAAMKKDCGCEVKFTVNWASLQKSSKNLSLVNVIIQDFGKVAAYCAETPKSKPAICKLKTFTVSKADETSLKFSGSAMTVTTDGNSVKDAQQFIDTLYN